MRWVGMVSLGAVSPWIPIPASPLARYGEPMPHFRQEKLQHRALASSRYWAVNSWDRMTLNLPFSKLGSSWEILSKCYSVSSKSGATGETCLNNQRQGNGRLVLEDLKLAG
jgi:hypothetical protein